MEYNSYQIVEHYYKQINKARLLLTAFGETVTDEHCNSPCYSHLQIKSNTNNTSYQLPNESTITRYLLDIIKYNDADLGVRLANINCDTDINRKQHDFKLAIDFLLYVCSVALQIQRGDPIPIKGLSGFNKGQTLMVS